MGLLDDVMGAAKGAMLQGTRKRCPRHFEQCAARIVAGRPVGRAGAAQRFGPGPSGVVLDRRWYGQPISVDQLKGALTPEHIQEIASALHMDPNSALAHLAEHLPMLAGKQA